MKKNQVKIKEFSSEIPDLQIDSNEVFEVELYYENQFVTRYFFMPGSRFRLSNLTKGDKVIIKALSL